MNEQYINSIALRLELPLEAVGCVNESARLIAENAESDLDAALEHFEGNNWSFDGMTERFRKIESLCSVPEYTVALIFLLAACKPLEARYEQKGYSKELFLATMSDIRYKALECRTVKGIWGNFVYWWYKGFYDTTRFALGRFQYEKRPFKHSQYSIDGFELREGDEVLNIHIPSSKEPITEAVRYDSYRQAMEFFYPDRTAPVPFACYTWLLWPDYEDYLPEGMNTKDFRRDFSVLFSKETEEFEDAWRIFGADAHKPASQLPQGTSQQRIFAKYIADGKKHGESYGVFFFDGRGILGKDI